MKKFIVILIVASLSLACIFASGTKEAGGTAKKAYPVTDIDAVIPFKAGGGTDNCMRLLASLAGKQLGVTIICSNITGASGATGMAYVSDKASDGYTILMTAESPCLYDVQGTGKYTFADYEQICLVGAEKVHVVVRADSPFKTFEDLINYAIANPKTLTLPISGAAAMGSIIGSMCLYTTGATFAYIPSEGDGDAFAQLLSGQADVVIAKNSVVTSYYESGEVRCLCSINETRLPGFDDEPAVLEIYPKFAECLPFSSFYCVSVKKDTPADVVDTLKKAFAAAFNDPSYQDYIVNTCKLEPMGFSGAEADEYIRGWRKGVITAMYAAGTISVSPESLGL